jgi:hypothetical protein
VPARNHRGGEALAEKDLRVVRQQDDINRKAQADLWRKAGKQFSELAKTWNELADAAERHDRYRQAVRLGLPQDLTAVLDEDDALLYVTPSQGASSRSWSGSFR